MHSNGWYSLALLIGWAYFVIHLCYVILSTTQGYHLFNEFTLFTFHSWVTQKLSQAIQNTEFVAVSTWPFHTNYLGFFPWETMITAVNIIMIRFSLIWNSCPTDPEGWSPLSWAQLLCLLMNGHHFVMVSLKSMYAFHKIYRTIFFIARKKNISPASLYFVYGNMTENKAHQCIKRAMVIML